MSLGVRGFNPIWSEVDLQGNLFDDTFWLFVLSNTIPYSPIPTYHDPDLSIPWTNPIQFLGNGTLPVDIFFNPDLVYRLEFRQGPDQSYPLIYEVNDYIPGSGGGNTPSTVALQSSNQITNPQFALINFASPLTVTGTNPDPIQIGPGWFLDVAGTGTAIITRVSLDNANKNPSNAPYAIRLQLSGWTTDSVFLRQRFEQNGMLWTSFSTAPPFKYVSASITAQIGATSVSSGPLTGTIVDSNNALLGTVLSVATLNGSWNQYPGHDQMAVTTNPNDPPAAYVDYKLAIPSNIDLYITSLQLVSGDLPLEPSFEQDSINRQIDHTYNTAYPIVPVGTIIDFGGFNLPSHYLLCDYATYNRVTYNLLFQAITNLETVTLTNTVATFTVADGTKYRIGMGLEGTGIPAFTTITGISGNTITMSRAATASGANAIRFFAAAYAYQETVSLTNTVNTFTVASAANYGIGMAVTGTGIPASTVITNIVGTTITMSNPASATVSSVVSFYSVGNGNTTTTFNVYNLKDFVIAGSGGSLFGAAANGLGAQGGASTHLLDRTEMPSPLLVGLGVISVAGGAAGVSFLNNNQAGSGILPNTGGGNAFSIVQQTALMKKCIRYE